MRSILVKVGQSHMNNQLFNIHNVALNRDNGIQPYATLRKVMQEHGISLDTVDLGNEAECDKILIFDLSKKNLKYVKQCLKAGWQKKLVLVLWEGPVVMKENWNLDNHKLFDKIFTWNDDFVDNKKYFKIYYPQPDLPFRGFDVAFSDKKCITMIAANKKYGGPGEIYSERINAIKFFEKNHPHLFDLYGMGWDRPVGKLQRIFPFMTPRYKCYRGPVKEKGVVFSQYKFSICYENTTGIKGYVTEKIFDCFSGGCIPVYLGADNITDYVPEDVFIDRRKFASYGELLDFLLSIDELQYKQYMERIRDYLQSDLYKLYCIDNFVKIMLQNLA